MYNSSYRVAALWLERKTKNATPYQSNGVGIDQLYLNTGNVDCFDGYDLSMN